MTLLLSANADSVMAQRTIKGAYYVHYSILDGDASIGPSFWPPDIKMAPENEEIHLR